MPLYTSFATCSDKVCVHVCMFLLSRSYVPLSAVEELRWVGKLQGVRAPRATEKPWPHRLVPAAAAAAAVSVLSAL